MFYHNPSRNSQVVQILKFYEIVLLAFKIFLYVIKKKSPL